MNQGYMSQAAIEEIKKVYVEKPRYGFLKIKLSRRPRSYLSYCKQ